MPIAKSDTPAHGQQVREESLQQNPSQQRLQPNLAALTEPKNSTLLLEEPSKNKPFILRSKSKEIGLCNKSKVTNAS